jgi:metal-responsive CopG/Arc/MetJ family transcriptional regulator
MRFTLTMPDDLVKRIDEEAERTGTSRAEWIRQACTDALTPTSPGPTPEEHRAALAEVQATTIRVDYLEQTIADLRADREYLRGEIARMQQENGALMHRLLPPPRTGVLSRLKRWMTGEPEK